MGTERIIIDIERYNELVSFKKEIEEMECKSRCLVITEFFGIDGNNTLRRYFTENEIIVDFTNENKRLRERIENLKVTIKTIKKDIDIIKEMSYFEFRKWKKNNN